MREGVGLCYRNRRVDLWPTKEPRIRYHDRRVNRIVCEFLFQVDPWFIHLIKQWQRRRVNRWILSLNFAPSRDTPRYFGYPRKTFTCLVQRLEMVFKRLLLRYAFFLFFFFPFLLFLYFSFFVYIFVQFSVYSILFYAKIETGNWIYFWIL